MVQQLGVLAPSGGIAAHEGHGPAGYWQGATHQAMAHPGVVGHAGPTCRRLGHDGNAIGVEPEGASVAVVGPVRRTHKHFGVGVAQPKAHGFVPKAAAVGAIAGHGLGAPMPGREPPPTKKQYCVKWTYDLTPNMEVM